MNAPVIERARPGDIGEIEELLRGSGLPIEGASAHLEHFFVARVGGSLAGVVGLEQYGEEGLLRSLAVREPHRSKGIGKNLYLRLVDESRSLGIRRLILLTTTAEAYFAARGFRKTGRHTITGALQQSAEFKGACPESALCMELVL
jgi:N-acetylglutamate synthase-like GNAT family acetyltransferase